MRMVRRGDRELNYYHQFPPQLFNPAADPAELSDRSDDPACREIRSDLITRALADWDPVRIEHRLAVRKPEVPLLREWLRRTLPPEPDPLWYNGPRSNWFRIS